MSTNSEEPARTRVTTADLPEDDSLMERFDRHGLRRFTARQGVIAIAVAAALLLISTGASIRHAGERMNPGPGRTILLAVGEPAGWVADQLPFAGAAHRATAWLSPDQPLTGPGRFISAGTRDATGQVPVVTPDAFDPAAIGATAPPPRKLHTLLITGDSMSMPLDADLAQQLAPRGVHVIRDPHVGTGISNTFIVDWGQLSEQQIRADRPDAVVVFIGANEGFPMTGSSGQQVSCCGADWAAIYANRVRQMANTYRQAGLAHVYWLTLPTPRDADRQRIARVVNAAIAVGVQPWAAQVRLIDTVPVFTPGNSYRDAMPVGGAQTIVRQADGIHLNDAGSSLLADLVVAALRRDYSY